MKQLPPSFILCPIFDDVNKWNFFYPPPSQIGKCLILGNFFFLKASLIVKNFLTQSLLNTLYLQNKQAYLSFGIRKVN